MKKSERLGFRVSPDDREKWEKTAAACGQSLSSWMTAWLNEGVRRYEELHAKNKNR